MQSVPVTDASSSVKMIAELPRIKAALDTAFRQEREVSELRARSAAVVERWQNVGVQGLGATLSEWEGRMTDAERSVRQAQVRRQRELDVV